MLSEIDPFFATHQPIIVINTATRNLMALQQKGLKSLSNGQKSSSWKTCFSLANMMLGSSMIVFPVLYKQMGIVTSLIVEAIICAVTLLTTRLYVRYNRREESDFSYTLKRVFGKKYLVFYCINIVVLLIFICIIYFILIASMFFRITSYLLQMLFYIKSAPLNEFTFSHFSYQWTGLLWAALIFLLFGQRNFSFLVKLTQYGFLSIIFIIIYNLIKALENTENINQIGQSDDSPLITTKFASLAGVFLFNFMSHPVVIPILKNNENQNNNGRDIIISYIIVGFTYALTGVSGAISLIGKKPREDSNGDTILDFFQKSDVLSLMVQFFLMMQLIAVLPILQFSSRKQFFSLFYGKRDPPELLFIAYNLIFTFIILAIQLANFNLSLIISIAGAIVSFFLVFYLPIIVHIKSLIFIEKEIPVKNIKRDVKKNLFRKIMVKKQNIGLFDIISIIIYIIIMLFGLAVAGYMLYEISDNK